jgi:hypothetical protein
MMKIVTKKLTDIHPAKKNIRRHTDKQLTEYIRSVEMFGQTKPILIDEAGEIIAGNGLYEALKQMGRGTAECRIMDGLTPGMKKKLMLSDNRVYELGITDMDIFDEILQELDGDMDIPGWDDDLLEMLNASAAEATDMVEGYGVYDEDEVEAMNRRSREEHIPGQGVEKATQRSLDGADCTNMTSNAAAPGGAEKTGEGDATITCPYCGGTICLPNV